MSSLTDIKILLAFRRKKCIIKETLQKKLKSIAYVLRAPTGIKHFLPDNLLVTH